MSELKAHRIDNIISAYKIGKAFCMKTEEEVYIKSEADKVIAEKDAAIAELTEKNKRLEEFKAKYSGCAEKAINTIAKCELKIRSLSRALFKACANWAWAEHVRYVDISDGTEGYIHAQERWGNMASKCLKKKEAFK